MSVVFDHVILAAADLEAEARALLEEHGLASIPGGRHPGHGTANRIVPLGGDYVELMGIGDRTEATTSAMGRWVSEAIDRGRHLLALSLRVGNVDAVARRLGTATFDLSRARPDGQVLRCRLTGLESAMGPERLPFFIQWDVSSELHPGRDAAPHRARPFGIAWIEFGGERERLEHWIGGRALDIRTVQGGEPGLRAFAVRTEAGEIVMRAE